jgi:hypothetical protein
MKMAPSEIFALARIIEELDYYQLLDLSRDAGAGEVKRAYHNSSRSFHPDANRHLDGELRAASQTIAKRITRPTRCCAIRGAARPTTAASRTARRRDAARRRVGQADRRSTRSAAAHAAGTAVLQARRDRHRARQLGPRPCATSRPR